MTPERVLALASLLVSLLLLARFGPPAWRSWRILAGVRQRRLADAGPMEIPPPDPLVEPLAQLQALGFRRIGERWLQLPGTPIRYEWVVGEPSGEVYIVLLPSIVMGGLFSACYTSWDDGTWLQTSYPRGAIVERPQLHASFVTTSLADAVATHRRTVDRYRARLGQPRRIVTMADTLRMDADYRTRHGGATLGGITLRNMTPAIGAAALVVISILLLLVAR
ncbi:MAG TPA: hypothetical protein VGI98_02015 [Candidatus Limnocylindrales bacterium]